MAAPAAIMPSISKAEAEAGARAAPAGPGKLAVLVAVLVPAEVAAAVRAAAQQRRGALETARTMGAMAGMALAGAARALGLQRALTRQLEVMEVLAAAAAGVGGIPHQTEPPGTAGVGVTVQSGMRRTEPAAAAGHPVVNDRASTPHRATAELGEITEVAAALQDTSFQEERKGLLVLERRA